MLVRLSLCLRTASTLENALVISADRPGGTRYGQARWSGLARHESAYWVPSMYTRSSRDGQESKGEAHHILAYSQ